MRLSGEKTKSGSLWRCRTDKKSDKTDKADKKPEKPKKAERHNRHSVGYSNAKAPALPAPQPSPPPKPVESRHAALVVPSARAAISVEALVDRHDTYLSALSCAIEMMAMQEPSDELTACHKALSEQRSAVEQGETAHYPFGKIFNEAGVLLENPALTDVLQEWHDQREDALSAAPPDVIRDYQTRLKARAAQAATAPVSAPYPNASAALSRDELFKAHPILEEFDAARRELWNLLAEKSSQLTARACEGGMSIETAMRLVSSIDDHIVYKSNDIDNLQQTYQSAPATYQEIEAALGESPKAAQALIAAHKQVYDIATRVPVELRGPYLNAR